MGRTTAHGWFYVPDYGEHGPAAHAAFSAALDAADELLDTMDLAPAHKHSTLWASDGSPQAIAVDAAGNVGIGTIAPGKTLEICDLANTTALRIRAGTTGTERAAQIDFFGGGIHRWIIASDYANEGLQNLIFYDMVNFNAALILAPSGNVGIGGIAFGTSAIKVLGIAKGTAPATAPADMAQMWVEDVNGAAGYCGLHKRTETTNQKEIVPGVIIKTDTGSPANPYDGLMEINTFDNKIRMYADAGWRELGTW